MAHAAGRAIPDIYAADFEVRDEADVYPRLGRTMEWDIAAGDAVLRAAGGIVRTLDGEALRYGKPAFANPHFAAWGLEG